MKTKMRKHYLLKLAAFLETVPKRALKMSSWVSQTAYKLEGDTPGDCGFAGCAVGWAAHAKLVPGLSLKQKYRHGIHYPYFHKRGEAGGTFNKSVCRAFGLDVGEVNWLFMPSSYGWAPEPTPKQVAKRLRQFVKDGGVPENVY